MKLPTVSFCDKITPDYKPSALLPSYRNKSTDNNNYSSRMAVILKGDAGQGADGDGNCCLVGVHGVVALNVV
jgi:hypothetical protein